MKIINSYGIPLIIFLFSVANYPLSRSIALAKTESEREKETRYFPTFQDAQQFANTVKAEILTISARDLIKNGKNKVFEIYLKARSINKATDKPVVIIISDIEHIMTTTAYEYNEDSQDNKAILELFDEIEKYHTSSHIISLFTTEIDPRQESWVISSSVNKRYWQIPDQKRTDEILQVHQILEAKRIEREAAIRIQHEKEQRRRDEEERQRKEREEQLKKIEEEKQKKEEELRLQKEKEESNCPLYKELVRGLNNDIIRGHEELQRMRSEKEQLRTSLKIECSNVEKLYRNDIYEERERYKSACQTIQKLYVALGAAVFVALIQPVSWLMHKIGGLKNQRKVPRSNKKLTPLIQ